MAHTSLEIGALPYGDRGSGDEDNHHDDGDEALQQGSGPVDDEQSDQRSDGQRKQHHLSCPAGARRHDPNRSPSDRA